MSATKFSLSQYLLSSQSSKMLQSSTQANLWAAVVLLVVAVELKLTSVTSQAATLVIQLLTLAVAVADDDYSVVRADRAAADCVDYF